MSGNEHNTRGSQHKSKIKPPQNTSSPRAGGAKVPRSVEQSPFKLAKEAVKNAKDSSKDSSGYVCSICQNTESIRISRLKLETELLSDQISKIDDINHNLSERASKIETLDLHLQHLLLDENKFINYQNRVTSIEENCNQIVSDIAALNSKPLAVAPSPCISKNDISDVCTELSDSFNLKLDSLEKSIQSIIDSAQQTSVSAQLPPISQPTPSPQQIFVAPPDTNLIKSIHHIEKYDRIFIDESTSDEIIEYFNNISPDFTKLNGRSVLSFGEPYPYVGAPKAKPAPIPQILQKLVSKVEDSYPNSEINSCLINMYTGGSSFLPEHSDDEPVIKPESNIFTITIGNKCDIKFRNRFTNDVETMCPENGSLYVMSRPSQNIWTHKIDKNPTISEETYTRYSITLRSVSNNYKSSTIILGDSNTKYLKFGNDKGSFGSKMPGRRMETFHIGDITPLSCLGYQNIIVHVGINDIRDRSPGRKGSDPAPSDIKGHFMRLKERVELIQLLCPQSSLIVSSVLPTKLHILNYRAEIFNRLLHNYVYNDNPGLRIINHKQFMLNDSLNAEYGCYKNTQDVLHLGKLGIRQLAMTFMNNALPYRRLRDGRSYSSVMSRGGKSAGATIRSSTPA